MKKYQLVIEEKRKQFFKECWAFMGLTIIMLGLCVGIPFTSESGPGKLVSILILLFLVIPMIKYQYLCYQYYFIPQILIIDGYTISVSTLLYYKYWSFTSFILSDSHSMVTMTLSEPKVEFLTKGKEIIIIRESINMQFSAVTADEKDDVWSKYLIENHHYIAERGENILLSDILIDSGFVEEIEYYEQKELNIDLFKLRKSLKDMGWLMRHKKEIRKLDLGPMSGPGIPEKSLTQSVTEMKKKVDEKRN
jgi:hypothetical protein